MPNKKPTKTAAPPALAPAMSPFDVETTPEAQRHLAATISQITLDFLAKGLRQVAVPLGQANAIKTAFEAATGATDPGPGPIRRWRVEIAKVNGLLAELHFSTESDPVVAVSASVLLPRIDELLVWSRTGEGEAIVERDDSPLGKILGNLAALRPMVGG